MTSLSALSVDELADGICLRAGRIAAAQAELLLWIAEFDRREGWGGPGMLSCAHWLSWRVGMSLGTARDQVRVARRLEDLAQLAAAFADGRVSYSKVRAITRVAEPDDGIDWVELARSSSAAQLDTLVRGVSRARAYEAAQDDPAQAVWRLRTRTRYDEDGSFVLTVRGPAHLLPVVRAGLEAKKAQLQRERTAAAEDARATVESPVPSTGAEPVPAAAPAEELPEPSSANRSDDGADLDAQAEGWPAGTTRRQVREAADRLTARQRDLGAEQVPGEQSRPDTGRALRPVPVALPTAEHAADDATEPNDADALLALAQEALENEHTTRPEVARRRRWQLTAQLDPVSGWARQADGELLPPSSLTAVLKTLPGRGGVLRLRRLTSADLRRSDLGRDRREVTGKLRELLGAVDGERCRFPGCTRRRKLHAHHVVYWSLGGPTDLALVLICSRHHTLIHAQGFQLELHPDRRLEVRTAEGVPVLHHPAQPWGDPATLAAGCGQLVSAETLPPANTDGRLDLRYAAPSSWHRGPDHPVGRGSRCGTRAAARPGPAADLVPRGRGDARYISRSRRCTADAPRTSNDPTAPPHRSGARRTPARAPTSAASAP